MGVTTGQDIKGAETTRKQHVIMHAQCFFSATLNSSDAESLLDTQCPVSQWVTEHP